MKTIKRLGILFVMLAMGCAKTSSDNIKTSGFFAHYSVYVSSANPNQATCSASYTVEDGSATHIELSGSDSVTCNGNSMSKSIVGTIVTYTAIISGVSTGTNFEIKLTRTGESPYIATVTMPEPVAGTSPANASSGTKGAVFNFAWTPSSNAGDTMYVQTIRTSGSDTNCPNSASFTDSPPENGTGSFSAADMTLPAGGTGGLRDEITMVTQSHGSCGWWIEWENFGLPTI